MPNVNITIPETTQTIFRPVILDIVSQVQEITKINKDTKIFFAGDTETMQTHGSGISDKDKFAIFNTDRYNFIEVTEDFDMGMLGSSSTDGRDNEPIFADNKLGVYMTPIYARSDVVINFKYRCPSKSDALRWRDDMRIRVSQMRDVNLHNITYHYNLSAKLMEVIEEVYTLREAVAPYGQTLHEYFSSHTTGRLALISDTVGKNRELVVTETQCRLLGIYDFEGMPEKPERDDSTATWTVSFSYKFSYDKVHACNLRYPVMIHNQLLSPRFTYFTDKTYKIDNINKRFPVSLNALRMFEYDTVLNECVDPNAIFNIPSFDDYVIPSVPTGTGTVFIALCEVDVTDKRTLLNLNELGDLAIDADILKFISEGEYRNICKLFTSCIHVSLYRNNRLLYDGALTCDSNLNIKSTFDLDLRDQHRVRFSLVVDISYLKKDSVDRMRKYPTVLVKIISSFNEILKNHKDFTDYGDKTIITENDFDIIYSIITGYSYHTGNLVGVDGNEWPYGARGTNGKSYNTIFKDLDPRVVENYRRNYSGKKTVMTTGTVVTLQSR